jgi:hypothetical protein
MSGELCAGERNGAMKKTWFFGCFFGVGPGLDKKLSSI